MDENKKKEMISKILKLLELGNTENNSNAHEAKVAQEKAAKLMADYQIDMKDLFTEKKGTAFTNIDVNPINQRSGSWETVLAGAVARCFDSEVVIRMNRVVYGSTEKDHSICFLGTKQDLDLSIFFFKYLRRSIGKMAESKYSGKLDRRDYALGAVVTISTRLQELYKRRDEVMDSECRALVVVKKDGVAAYVSQMFPKLKNSNGPTIHNRDAMWKGREDGKKVNLSRPISGHGNEVKGALT